MRYLRLPPREADHHPELTVGVSVVCPREYNVLGLFTLTGVRFRFV